MIKSADLFKVGSVSRWERAFRLFSRSLELEEPARSDFLERTSDASTDLRSYVRLLLSRYESAGSFLEEPAGRLGSISAPPLEEGAVLGGRFEIVRLVGSGGIGEVYAARDLELGDRLALKRLRPELAGNSESVELLKRETQLARKVTHPNVCRIFDFNTDPQSGVAFLTMELLEGVTLAQRLSDRGPMAPDDALALVRALAEGLHAAHRAGIVHGDLKPSNVMIVEDRSGARVVVTDFGLALPQAEAERRNGAVGGTPLYMAPEQLLGGRIRPASDVFALGLILYVALTNRLPEGPSTVSALIEAANNKTQPRDLAREQIPKGWAPVILKCIEPDPRRRYQSASELIEALDGPSVVGRRAAVAAIFAFTAAGVGAAVWPEAPAGGRSAVEQADAAWQKGRLHAARLLPEELQRAIRYFRRSVELDPEFAMAYADLSVSYSRLGDYGGLPPKNAFDRAQTAASRAIAIDPELAEAHAALGLALSLDVSRWTTAEASFRTALRLDRDHGPTHQWLAAHLARLGRTGEAIVHAQEALAADPVSLPGHAVLGWMYYYDGQMEAAIEQGAGTVDLDPNFLYGHVLLARSYTALSRFGSAFGACARAKSVSRSDVDWVEPVVTAAEAGVYAAQGETSQARSLVTALEGRAAVEYVPAIYIASIYSSLGDFDRSIDLLEAALSDSDPSVLYSRVYPPLSGLQGRPRFQSLLRGLGLSGPGEGDVPPIHRQAGLRLDRFPRPESLLSRAGR